MRAVVTMLALAFGLACAGGAERPAVPAAPARSAPIPGEGLYRPGEVALPAGVERALRSVVRVAPDVRFRLLLFADPAIAARARSAEGARDKEFLPEGGTVWPVIVDTAALGTLCAHPAGRVQPGFAELCRLDWRRGCDGFPCRLLTGPLAGSATGVVVGRSPEQGLLVLTNYHVARESIERHGRTAGVDRPTPVPAPDLAVAVDTTRRHDGYRRAAAVRLIANAAEADWQSGRDWALLAVPVALGEYAEPARLAVRRPGVGDTVWAAGFPYRTVRESTRSKGYANAADELRVSIGTVVPARSLETDIAPTDIVSTLDAVSGSSGSPVFDRSGALVGLVRDGTCREGEIDLRILRYCGHTLIVPIELVRDVVAPLIR